MSGSLPAEKSRSVSEIIVVGAVTLAAFVFTLWYLPAYRAAGGASQFYQNEFGPSVMLTCQVSTGLRRSSGGWSRSVRVTEATFSVPV